MRDICFVTGNQNKFVEVKKLIKNFNLISNSDLNIDEEIPETENTIKGNSYLKSNYVHKKFGLPCFADDSGLFIKALNGDPGVKSARYASDKSDSDLNIDLSDWTLENWAKQGVLLLNRSLSVLQGNSNSHKKQWTDFNIKLMEFILVVAHVIALC